jgi:hypothetical protein
MGRLGPRSYTPLLVIPKFSLILRVDIADSLKDHRRYQNFGQSLVKTQIPALLLEILIQRTWDSVGEDVGKKEPSYTVGGNVN